MSDSTFRTLALLLLLIFSVPPSSASGAVLNPTAGTGIRDFGTGPFLLEFKAVKRDTEDRTALEFDLTGLSGPVPVATLDLGIGDLDDSDGEGILDVFPYVGNGAIEPADFFAGAFFSGFNLDGVNGLVHLDVTDAVNSALIGGTQILGFRLSTVQASRFNLGTFAGFPEPTLSVVEVPEPSGFVLAALGLIGLVVSWRRRRR